MLGRIRRTITLVRETGGPALAVLAVISFVSSLGIAIMLPLLPLYGLHLGATPTELGLMTTAFAVTNAAAQLGSGFLMERFGARRFVLAGTGIYAAGNALIATAGSSLALIFYRGVAGIGGGVNMVATQLYVSQSADPTRLAFFNSILAAARSSGNVLGPALGGLVAASADLRTPFLIVAATSGLALVAAAFLPRPREERHVAKAGVAPGSPWNRSVFVLLAANLLLLMGFGGWITSYAPFATQRLGWTPFDIGIVFTLFGIGDITLGPWLGHLADRTGRRRMAVLASIPIFLFGFVLVLGLPKPFFYAISFITGASLTAFNASWMALLTTAVPPRQRGRVFGIVMAVAQAGTIIGANGAAALWEAVDISAGMILASFAALGAGLVLLLLPRELPAPRQASAAAPAD
jgi:MFS transporter, DHA1 family, multidrug resistance protein